MKEGLTRQGSLEDCRKGKSDARPILWILGLTAFALLSSVSLLWLGVSEKGIVGPGRVLLLTAHPDDETVFFGPTLTALRARKIEVFLYCLTQGNARGLGDLRIGELARAANALQINADHLRIENNEKQLPDSKVVDWDMQLAVQLLDEEVKRRDIDTIITFDSGGITGHKNHVSCWQAVRRYVTQCTKKGCPVAYSVLTAGKWHDYNHLFDRAPRASRPESHRIVRYYNKHVWRVFWAMHYHKSQWRWKEDRHFTQARPQWSHVLFTRYTYINTLQHIDSRMTPAMSTS